MIAIKKPSPRVLRIRFLRDLGRGLAGLRKAAWLKQTDLADALDVSVETVSRWENGHNAPTLENRRKIEIKFGNTLEALLDFDPKNWSRV